MDSMAGFVLFDILEYNILVPPEAANPSNT